jgi:AcrR family transcriptional regulator
MQSTPMSQIRDAKHKARGRPPLAEAQLDQMRHRITEAAQRLFQDEGYDAISIRRLAKDVGCTPMSLYSYFDGKIDILRALWADVFSRLFLRVNAAASADQDPSSVLLARCKAYVQFWLEHRDSYRMVFMSGGIDQTDVSVFVETSPVAGDYATFLEALALATDRPMSETVEPAQALICGLNGISHSLITISGYPWSAPDTLVTLLVNGAILSARKGT